MEWESPARPAGVRCLCKRLEAGTKVRAPLRQGARQCLASRQAPTASQGAAASRPSQPARALLLQLLSLRAAASPSWSSPYLPCPPFPPFLSPLALVDSVASASPRALIESLSVAPAFTSEASSRLRVAPEGDRKGRRHPSAPQESGAAQAASIVTTRPRQGHSPLSGWAGGDYRVCRRPGLEQEAA